MRNDDSDVKIFASKAKSQEPADEFEIVEELARQSANGNTAKAKQLGALL
ncbi:MAG: hypothetical protein GX851_03545, partial [Clostridiales bacterium]|nr:hypothetical protein [Clostridiales bacterium]